MEDLVAQRPSNQTRIMTQLDLLRSFSTCNRAKVACAAIDNSGLVLLTSLNGAPIGMPHCIATKDGERCTRCIHAERNLINKAARIGANITGKDIWVTHRPCISCANDLIQVGVAAVIYRWDYDTDESSDYVRYMFNKAKIFVAQLEYTMEEELFNEVIRKWADVG